MFRFQAPRHSLLRGGRLPVLAAVTYAAVLGVMADRGREAAGWVCALGAVSLALAASRRATRALRRVGWGSALVLASIGAERSSRALDACGGVGLLVSVGAACAVMARLSGTDGVVRGEPRTGRVEGALLAAVWGLAVAATSASFFRDAGGVPATARWGAMAVSAGALAASWEIPLRRRRFELAVVARARAARSLASSAGVAALVVAVLGHARPESAARVALVVASWAVAEVGTHSDPVRVARFARRALTLTTFGGTAVMVGATAAEGRAGSPWSVAVVTAVATLVIGALAERLEGPFSPAGGAWLRASTSAADAVARHGDPFDAIRAVLLALRQPLGPGGPPPELWTLHPPVRTIVDAAGYVQEREGGPPVELVALAAAEPEGAVMTDILDALQVRRPELRSCAAWLIHHGALFAVVVAGDGSEVDGVLLVPRARRAEPVALEEVRALRQVAARLAAACRSRAKDARMLARVREATAAAEASDQRADRMTYEHALEAGRHALAAARVAHAGAFGNYAAASRMALDALERRAAVSAPMAVVVPSGVDAAAVLARAHLSGARRARPLALVDATRPAEHDPARWLDPTTSPLALADGGMLALLDGAALPLEVQRIIARASAEGRTPWERPERLDVQLALTGVEVPASLVASGRLDPSLASRLGDALDAPVVLPRLRDRPEDFRALVLDGLVREGLRVFGRPVGIEPAAYARLAEHPFPGDEAELSLLLARLVARSTGEVVRRADVDALLPGIAPPSRRSTRSSRRKDPISA